LGKQFSKSQPSSLLLTVDLNWDMTFSTAVLVKLRLDAGTLTTGNSFWVKPNPLRDNMNPAAVKAVWRIK
jgi:hypothetical protein